MNGTNVCRMHGGAAPQVRRRAQQRLDEASDVAVQRILAIMNDRKISASVRLSAARDVLDRAGIVSAKHVDVAVEMQSWERIIQKVVVTYDDEPDGAEG